jgi:O-antigen ligase
MEFIYTAAFVAAAFMAAIFAALAIAGATHYTKGKHTGWLQYYFYVVLLYMAVTIIFSNRELTAATADVVSDAPLTQSAIAVWTSRLVSVFLVVSSLERLFSVWLSREKRTPTAAFLALAFIVLWLTSVASPAFLGRHRYATHDNLYPLLIGWAAIQFSARECSAALFSARNGTLLFVLLGYLFVPFRPGLVMETGYTQGYIAGLPRFVGLAAHAVALGLLVQVALLLLWHHPYRNVWLNRAAWSLCLITLFLAQSKTAWISFVLSAAVMLAYRNGKALRKRVMDPTRPQLSVALIGTAIAGAILLSVALFYADAASSVMDYLDSAQGNQLLTLTGRDKIWAITLREFYANPLFGYGPQLFSEEYRQSIGMPFATHGHNQLMDSLARSGLVGTIPLVGYFILLTVLSIRYASVTRGLSLALYLVLAFRCVSEVPLAITTNTQEFLAHLALLIVLVGAAHAQRKSPVVKPVRAAIPLWAMGQVRA